MEGKGMSILFFFSDKNDALYNLKSAFFAWGFDCNLMLQPE